MHIMRQKNSNLNLLDNLNNVLIIQNVVSANLLRLMFHACSPNQRIFELLHDSLVYSVAEVLYRPPVFRKHNWVTIVWQFALHSTS